MSNTTKLVLGLLVLFSSLLVPFAEVCPRSFNCGVLGELSFPFTNSPNSQCGLYVRGCDDQGGAIDVHLGDEDENENLTWLEIESIGNASQITSLHVRSRQLDKKMRDSSRDCRMEDYNITLPPATPIMSFEKEFQYTLTLCRCNRSLDITPPEYFQNNEVLLCGEFLEYYLYYGLLIGDALPSAFNSCTIAQIPANSVPISQLKTSYTTEFTLKVTLSEDCYKCFYESGGQCRLDNKGNFSCVFQDHQRGSVNVLVVATATSAALVAIMLMVLVCCLRRKVTSTSILFWKGENPTHQNIEIFLKTHEFLLTKRYTYSEIRQMTDSFKNKLGQGGYGSVYKGKLPDGRLVAVKVLNELKGNGEEFINEVASISQTSHVNIVSLFGFCFQGSKRALVYEFMPNGSLEKFTYEENDAMVDRQLDCKTLHDIAIGTARGLEYLHRGCNTRILHFDIKPHNILLDADFCPKISDFGLAKICTRKESIVSLWGTRGTAGYIAPEVFSRNFGAVSHKSDVYSFGMMVLEMVGGRKKGSHVEVESSSEMYFPNWIYKCIELNQELELRCIKSTNDYAVAKKMIVVSLWCIQTDPSARPAMSKVVDMLEGSLESLEIPPKPFLSSPKTSPAQY
ncbi:Serine/threonine-protein kinase, active site [Sesbania bispinosa]|nr:Serine/threonine-protein kinase, active site [Sesbania bispinosa]